MAQYCCGDIIVMGGLPRLMCAAFATQRLALCQLKKSNSAKKYYITYVVYLLSLSWLKCQNSRRWDWFYEKEYTEKRQKSKIDCIKGTNWCHAVLCLVPIWLCEGKYVFLWWYWVVVCVVSYVGISPKNCSFWVWARGYAHNCESSCCTLIVLTFLTEEEKRKYCRARVLKITAQYCYDKEIIH